MKRKTITKYKIKPMFQKHQGSKTIKRFGIELRVDYSPMITIVFFVVGFMSKYYYIGLTIRRQRRFKK